MHIQNLQNIGLLETMSKFWSDIVNRLTPYTPGEQPKDNILLKLNTKLNLYYVFRKNLRLTYFYVYTTLFFCTLVNGENFEQKNLLIDSLVKRIKKNK